MKDFRDIKKEYGLCLRWLNGGGDDHGNTWSYTFWLENIYDPEKEKYYIMKSNGEILNDEAYKLICEKTVNGFRNKGSFYLECYDNYVKHFEIKNIGKLYTLKDILKEKEISIYRLSKNTLIPNMTLSNIVNNDVQYKNTSVNNAMAISKALNMTVEDLYNKLYFERVI